MLTRQSGLRRTRSDVFQKLGFLVRQGKRLGLLRINAQERNDENEFLESFRSELTDGGGQYLSLDFSRFEEEGVAEKLLAELEAAHIDCPLRINLPFERSNSPFIQRAIAWQRLCDRLIEDEEPPRPTVLVIENYDQADERTRCEVERLIRFHIAHNIRRTFLLTLHGEDQDALSASLARLIDLSIEC